MAMACLGLVTFLPERPLFSFPFFISRISVSTCLPAAGPYWRVELFFAEDFFAEDFFAGAFFALVFFALDFFVAVFFVAFLVDDFFAAFFAVAMDKTSRALESISGRMRCIENGAIKNARRLRGCGGE